MATVPGLCAVLRHLLGETADGAARAMGFVRRRSKLTGAAFVQALVFGWLNRPGASLEEAAQTAAAVGVPISAQGPARRRGPVNRLPHDRDSDLVDGEARWDDQVRHRRRHRFCIGEATQITRPQKGR